LAKRNMYMRLSGKPPTHRISSAGCQNCRHTVSDQYSNYGQVKATHDVDLSENGHTESLCTYR